eukprot:ANDGO_06923.mRNA.1 Putative leucine-rich repeat-containing protein DDB_G0281931
MRHFATATLLVVLVVLGLSQDCFSYSGMPVTEGQMTSPVHRSRKPKGPIQSRSLAVDPERLSQLHSKRAEHDRHLRKLGYGMDRMRWDPVLHGSRGIIESGHVNENIHTSWSMFRKHNRLKISRGNDQSSAGRRRSSRALGMEVEYSPDCAVLCKLMDMQPPGYQIPLVMPTFALQWETCANASSWSCCNPNTAGVSCQVINGVNRVTKIIGSSWNLVGNVPVEFSQLEYLVSLELNDNNFIGSFPTWLLNLSHLTDLQIAGNFLSGPLPSNWTGVPALQILYLGYNLFEGAIPDAIYSLRDLGGLYLTETFIGGPISPMIGQATSLTLFVSEATTLIGELPDVFANLTRLRRFSVSANSLNGTLPPSIYECQSLQFLLLDDNFFFGEIPNSISQLTFLRVLYINENNFTGTVPTALASLSGLESLGLQVNSFSGTLPGALANCTLLAELQVYFNDFSYIDPSLFNPTSMLTYVDVSFNSLTEIPDSVGLLSKLLVLKVDANNLTAFPINAITSVSTLNLLSMSFNLIYDSYYDNNDYNCQTLDAASQSYVAVLDISNNPNIFCNLYSMYLCNAANYGGGALVVLNVAHSGIYVEESYTMVAYSEEHSCGLLSLITLDLTGCNVADVDALDVVGRSFPALEELMVPNSQLQSDIAQMQLLPFMLFFNASHNPNFQFNVLDYGASLVVQPSASTMYNASANGHYFCFEVESIIQPSALFVVDIDILSQYQLCFCDKGFYGKPPHCALCPTNAVCPGPDLVAARTSELDNVDARYLAYLQGGTMFAETGYWASPPYDLDDLQRGMYPTTFIQCNGFGAALSRCRPNSSNFTQACEDGYTDRLCSKCSSSYFSVSAEWSAVTTCLSCSNQVSLPWFLFILILCLIIVMIVAFVSSASTSGFLKILIFFLQFVAQLRLPIPSGAGGFFSTIFAMSSLSLFGPECYVDWWNYESQFILAILVPVGCAIAIGFVWISGKLLSLVIGRSLDAPFLSWNDRCVRALLFLMYVAYISTCLAIFTPLKCSLDSGTGERYLTNVPYKSCNTWIRPVAITYIILFVFGLPALLFFIVYAALKKGGKTEDIARARKVYGLLFGTFISGFEYWEILITFRRLGLAAVFLNLDYHSSFQGMIILFILFSALYLQVLYSPYSLRTENIMESCGLILVALNYVVSLQFESSTIADATSIAVFLMLLNVTFIFVDLLLLFMTTKIFARVFRRSALRLRKQSFRRSWNGVPGEDVALEEVFLKQNDRELVDGRPVDASSSVKS